MNPETFFDKFGMLADVPGGVSKLRGLILQLAVQGKLVPQDPNDEPAAVLLETIKAEKERLVKETKIKKGRLLPPIDQKQIPYELPSGWEWVRLGDVGNDCGQKKPDVKFTYIDVSAINKERGVISDDVDILEPNEAPSRARKLVSEGSVIYATVRPYLLNIAIIDRQFEPEPIVSTAFAVIHPFSGILNKYLYFYLRSKPFIAYVESEMIGMAYPAINDGKLYQGLVPIPPSNEQKRIVAKVDQLMALCDELEARQQKKQEARLRLNSAALDRLLTAHEPAEFANHWQRVCDNFDLLYDNPETVGELRKAILQLAVQGKLVRQDENDEPAAVLLEKIRAEKERLVKEGKIKMSKPLSLLKENDIPFELPFSWIWIQLGEVLEYNGAQKVSPNEIPDDAWLLDLENIEKDTSRIIERTIFKDKESKSTKSKFEKGDVLYGKLRPYLNKVVVADGEGYCTTEIIPLRGYYGIFPKYLMYALKRPDFLEYVNSKTYGVKMPRLGTEDGRKAPFPLPPFEEQRRIVAKVDQLMALCDDLEANLNQQQTDGAKLMRAVVARLVGA